MAVLLTVTEDPHISQLWFVAFIAFTSADVSHLFRGNNPYTFRHHSLPVAPKRVFPVASRQALPVAPETTVTTERAPSVAPQKELPVAPEITVATERAPSVTPQKELPVEPQSPQPALLVASQPARSVAPKQALPVYLAKSLPVAPQPARPVASFQSHPEQVSTILRDDSNISPDGSYEYAYETENGISAQQQGQQKSIGSEFGQVAQGGFQYTSPEGIPVVFKYVADENGFQPLSDLLPTSPPVPAAILRALEWNAAHPEPQDNLVSRRLKRALIYY